MRSRPDRFGFGVAVLTAVFGLVALGLAVTTTPRAGPFCPAECLDYPYAGAVALVPRDFLWMYPATVMLLTFLILTIVVLAHAGAERRLPGMIGVAFALLATSTLVIDYAIQLAVVQPSLLAGESDGVLRATTVNARFESSWFRLRPPNNILPSLLSCIDVGNLPTCGLP